MNEPDPTLSTPRKSFPLLLLLFVGSGCAALIYEIVWYQLLQLVIGMTTVSLGLLLGTFMGGMCLGSLALPRLVSLRRHPLRVYAMLELGIGSIGVALLFGMPSIARLYTSQIGHGLSAMMLRGAVAAVCLLPPTLLMGATLPAIARWVETTPQGVSWLGFFYGGNIAGAVFGCLLAGFYLLRVHDVAVATYVAAGINAAVALIALALAARTPRQAPADDSNQTTAVRQPGSGPVYIAIALSGMSALGAEVIWTRLLSLMLGGTVYTFSIILAVFLAGLGIGSSAGAFLAREVPRPWILLGCCQFLLTAALAWTAYMITHSLPYWPIDPSLSLSPWYSFQLDLARCLWAILPGALLWGASFPLALASVALPGQDPGRLVGGIYAANTVGAIVGALGFSMLLIPWVGSRQSQQALIALAALSALVVFAPPVRRSASKPPVSGKSAGPASDIWNACLLGVAMGIAFMLAWSVSPTPWGLTAYGRCMAVYGSRLTPGITKEANVPIGEGTQDIYCIYQGEGINGSVVVTEYTNGARFFHSAGKVQASSEPADMRLQRLLGHISALIHRDPKSVLVVACGAGVTAGTFVLYPSVSRIVICDIEPLVPKNVAPLFKTENYNVVNDPRTEVVCDDGRHFIRMSREKFDIITSDPIDPWVKGCAALNTVEYYEMCKEHLNPGGLVSLWIPFYQSDMESVKSLISTFFKVFPNGTIWSNDIGGSGYDAILVGQVEPTHIDLEELQGRMGDNPAVTRSLSDVGINSADAMLATYAGQGPDLREWMRGAQINTDRNLRLQCLAGIGLNSQMSERILNGLLVYRKFPEKLFIGSEERTRFLREALSRPSGK